MHFSICQLYVTYSRKADYLSLSVQPLFNHHVQFMFKFFTSWSLTLCAVCAGFIKWISFSHINYYIKSKAVRCVTKTKSSKMLKSPVKQQKSVQTLVIILFLSLNHCTLLSIDLGFNGNDAVQLT